MAAPAVGLVGMEALMCLSVVLICLACVSTRLPWVLLEDLKPLRTPRRLHGLAKVLRDPHALVSNFWAAIMITPGTST